MPVQKQKSNLMAKLGDKLRKAHEEHRNDETEFSNFGDLPAGINGGIAQLIECKFDRVKEGKDNAGEFYFYAAGAVMSPKEFEGQRIEGLRTSITEPLYDTPTRSRPTTDDHIKWIYNELRKLGVDTSQMEFEDLENTVAVLREAKPYFKFRTWKGEMQTTGQYANKEPRVQHQWSGYCEYTPDDDPGAGTEDDTPTGEDSEAGVEEGAETNGEVEEAPAPVNRIGRKTASPPTAKTLSARDTTKVEVPPTKKPLRTKEVVVDPPKSIHNTTPAFDDQGDIDTLVKRANKGDEAARQELAELAVANGADPDAVEHAKSWEVVAQMAMGHTPEEVDAADEPEPEAVEEEPESEEETPQPTELWWYRPIDTKTRKPVKKSLECEVLKVYPPSKMFTKGAADVRSIDTRATYKGVPIPALKKTAEE